MEDINLIIELLMKEDGFLITSHIRPDGDSISSQLAIMNILQQEGKRCQIVNPDPCPDLYQFLPGSHLIKPLPCTLEGHRVSLVLDCNEWERLGKVEDLARGSEIVINIDHHKGSGVGDYNFIDPAASSTSEQIFDLSRMLSIELWDELALCLYVGIFTDTGAFQYPNTTSHTHFVASELLKYRVSPDKVSRLTKSFSPHELRLLALMLERLRISLNGQFAWTTLTQEMLKETGCIQIETELISGLLRAIPGVQAIAIFREMKEKGKIRVSLRSVQEVDVREVASSFGGGGHSQAAGCTVQGRLEDVEDQVLLKMEEVLSDVETARY